MCRNPGYRGRTQLSSVGVESVAIKVHVGDQATAGVMSDNHDHREVDNTTVMRWEVANNINILFEMIFEMLWESARNIHLEAPPLTA